MKIYKRAGVIPYTVINGSTYFLLGKDTASGELTDFGGGVKINEKWEEGAIREFKEETNGIFSESTYDHTLLTASPYVKNFEMTIYFLKVESKWLEIAPKKFYFKTNDFGYYQKKPCQEIQDVLWLHETKFKNLVKFGGNDWGRDGKNNHKMWKKVQKFLNKDVNENFLLKLKN